MTDVQVIETEIGAEVVQSATLERELVTEAVPTTPDNPELVTLLAPYIKGDKGDPGTPGAAGAPGADGQDGIDANASYRHVQIVAASTWTVTHNLGFKPAGIVVVDSGGTTVEGADVAYVDDNTLTLTFAAGFGGEAFVS